MPTQPQASSHTGGSETHGAHPTEEGRGFLNHSSRSQGHNPEQAAGGVEEPGRGAQAGRGRQRQRAGRGGGDAGGGRQRGLGSPDRLGPQEPHPTATTTRAREKERAGRRAKRRERSREEIFTFPPHAHFEALLEAAVLALVAMVLVDGTVPVGTACVS